MLVRSTVCLQYTVQNEIAADGLYCTPKRGAIVLHSRVIGLAGGIGSGKSTIARALSVHFQCPIVSFGDYVRRIAEKSGQRTSRYQLQAISEALLSSLGPQGLTRAVLAEANWDRRQSLIVDGIRLPAVIDALRVEAAPLLVVILYLDVPPDVRAERFAARDNLSSRELAGLDEHLTEREVAT